MGYRCPRCKEDFGNDNQALHNHFKEFEYCAKEALEIYWIKKEELSKMEKEFS